MIRTKGQMKPKSRFASRRFSQKPTDEFDLFAVKSKKKGNKTNSTIHFLGESMARQSTFEINWPLTKLHRQALGYFRHQCWLKSNIYWPIYVRTFDKNPKIWYIKSVIHPSSGNNSIFNKAIFNLLKIKDPENIEPYIQALLLTS